MKYKIVYRCPICGDLVALPDTVDCSQEEALKSIRMTLLTKDFQNITHHPMNIPHFCKDGSLGVMQFSGLQKA